MMEEMTRGEKAEAYFHEGYNCAQSIIRAYQDLLPVGMEDTIVALGSGLGGGVGRLREICGAMSGSVLVLDALCGYSTPDTGEKKKILYKKIQKLADGFEASNGSLICRELLGLGEGKDSPVPEARTAEYYVKRPCGTIVRNAADNLWKFLKEEDLIPSEK